MTATDDGLHVLARGGVEAVVSRRAAALRRLTVGGTHVVEPTVLTSGPPGMSGAVLAPWPNRVEGAVWRHAGRDLRLDVTEPDLGHANHGLVAHIAFDVVRERPGMLELAATVDAPAGYPFRLEVRVRYRLRRAGVDVRIAVRNLGDEPAPIGLGAHPYLRVGDVPTDALRVRVDADAAYRLDAAHIPRGSFPVTGTPWDLRRGRPVPDAPGHATLRRSGNRAGRHVVVAPDGRAVELRAAAPFRWTQVYLADALATDDGPRLAIAIEPMTAPPNALRTGEGIRVVDPGRRWSTGFRLRLRQGRSRDR